MKVSNNVHYTAACDGAVQWKNGAAACAGKDRLDAYLHFILV